MDTVNDLKFVSSSHITEINISLPGPDCNFKPAAIQVHSNSKYIP